MAIKQPQQKQPPHPPKNPTKYTESDHFKQRLKQPGRYITRDEVNQLIKNGNWTWEQHNWKITAIISGLKFTAVISTHTTEIVTAYIAVTNKQKAKYNPHYTTEQINTMTLRTKLAWNPNQLTPQYYKTITINTPFHLRNHTVHTPKNQDTLQCTQCNYTAHKKEQFATKKCTTNTDDTTQQ